jgi:transcriptional regulator with XRE-family HTH domain
MDPALLRAWRLSHGLSRRAMAEMTGVPERTLEGLEAGRSVNTSPWWVPLERMTAMMDRIEVLEAAIICASSQ